MGCRQQNPVLARRQLMEHRLGRERVFPYCSWTKRMWHRTRYRRWSSEVEEFLHMLTQRVCHFE
ncbi:hypothetical protein ANCDUO_12206 [Ancylostoma duodenale]|uniref:Uncharacterized protein n=1 Tax=Ancylostoma duodenale TaxID=51022 RepID=A0A0C2GFC5_9BILA|nr:hypothetical protein ANCDUO_12206 [Ancylostoma duodenale]